MGDVFMFTPMRLGVLYVVTLMRRLGEVFYVHSFEEAG
jgi:hypothetical protein